MTQYQQYFGRFTIPATMTAFNCSNGAVGDQINCYINTGTVYPVGYGNESTDNLVERVQNAIRAQVPGQTTTNIVYAPATGKITINLTATGNIAWTDPSLMDALGYTANCSGSASFPANKQLRYTWRPTRGLADHPLDINTWWTRSSTSKVTRSVDGTVRTVQGNQLYEGAFEYRNLPKADVVANPLNSADNFRSLESFWGDVIHPGARIRAYPDRTCSNSGAYKEGYWVVEESKGEAMDVGGFSEQIGRSVAGYDPLWDVEFVMLKHV